MYLDEKNGKEPSILESNSKRENLHTDKVWKMFNAGTDETK